MTWQNIINRTDSDAKIIRKLIMKISVFPRYEDMSCEEIYKKIKENIELST